MSGGLPDRKSRLKVVAVGYPKFFPPDGGDRTFLSGGRCEDVKEVDQRWMMEQVDKLNGVIARHARRRGFLYFECNRLFSERALGGEDGEWLYPVPPRADPPQRRRSGRQPRR